MPNSKNNFLTGVLALGASLSAFVIPLAAHAMCPVCTVAIGAGVGLSRWLGIDDTISGTWIGGLTVSLAMWTDDWMERKNWKIRGRLAAVLAGYVVLIIVPLRWLGITGHPFNRFYGVDKLLLGIVAGGLAFTAAAVAYNYLKKKNGGHAWFPYQKVVMPVGTLAILSAIFYFLT